MKRIAMAAAAAMLNALGAHGLARGGIGRIPAETKLGRQMISKGYRSRSKYMPHQGVKERERATRCHQSHWLNEQVATFHPRDGHLRCSPTLCQMSKRAYEAHFREID